MRGSDRKHVFSLLCRFDSLLPGPQVPRWGSSRDGDIKGQPVFFFLLSFSAFFTNDFHSTCLTNQIFLYLVNKCQIFPQKQRMKCIFSLQICSHLIYLEIFFIIYLLSQIILSLISLQVCFLSKQQQSK